MRNLEPKGNSRGNNQFNSFCLQYDDKRSKKKRENFEGMLFKKRKRNPDLNLTPESVLHSRAQALVLPKDTRERQSIFGGKLFPTTRLPRVRQTCTGSQCGFCGCVLVVSHYQLPSRCIFALTSMSFRDLPVLWDMIGGLLKIVFSSD